MRSVVTTSLEPNNFQTCCKVQKWSMIFVDRQHSDIIITINMKWLSVSLALCSLLGLSRAVPVHPNSTSPVHNIPRQTGHCAYIVHDLPVPVPIGMFVPQCDANGNFLPQQCSGSTGYCWCVNVLTGEKIPGTETPPGVVPVNCGKWWPTVWSYIQALFRPGINIHPGWSGHRWTADENTAKMHWGHIWDLFSVTQHHQTPLKLLFVRW